MAKASGVTAVCKITIKKPEKPSIELDKTQITLEVNKTYKLNATVKNSTSSITWNSNNINIATVSSQGLITGKKVGSTIITAKIGTISATCKVVITASPILAQQVYSNNGTSAIIKADGSLWIWGTNGYGQAGTTERTYSPQKIMDGVSKVSIGNNHSAAIKKDGSLWTWIILYCSTFEKWNHMDVGT